jgi:nicotinamide riboside kinase
MIKVAITGPECSGKSALALALASRFQVSCIPEAARTYLDKLDRTYTQDDLDVIARRQQMMINGVKNQDVLISDTEMLVLKIWSEVKYGKASPYIESLWENQDFDLYLLCNPDIPYEPDPLRENPDNRDELFKLYKTELTNSNKNFIILSENLESRLKWAVDKINSLTA